ncbi:hypothetical protein M413DRAFT_449984, partial [Hebeloma cylindrosporum]
MGILDRFLPNRLLKLFNHRRGVQEARGVVRKPNHASAMLAGSTIGLPIANSDPLKASIDALMVMLNDIDVSPSHHILNHAKKRAMIV